MHRRDGYIPVSKADLIAAMADAGGLDADDSAHAAALARLYAAIIHYEAHDALEGLRDLYAPLDPETPQDTPAERFDAFEAALIGALGRANFEEIDAHNELSARAARQLTGLAIKASPAGIRRIRFFARGPHAETVTVKRWLGLRKREVLTEAYADVVVLVAFKSMEEISRRERGAFARLRRGARPGSALIKHFRNVARAELLTLHPGARPTMRAHDQVFLAAPALIGGAPIAMQIVPAVTVLFAVVAAYFGTRAAIDNSALQRALAAASGLIAVGAFVGRQWLKYERQTLKYQKQLADTVYFRNLANNSGVLDALIGAGEEQDVKEALLAYWTLRRAGKALTHEELDEAIEAFLLQRFATHADFEVGDAEAKLARHGLVSQTDGRVTATPMKEGLARLDAAWDRYFSSAQTAAE
jgi:hypothetical protein